jgi:hypothetical protein
MEAEREAGGDESSKLIVKGQCHCGSVKLSIVLSDGYKTARRCDCSLCRMRGAVAVSSDVGGITVEEGAECVSLYQFNAKEAKHYFCKKCGVYTHHQRRSNPNQYGVNVAIIDNMSPFDFPQVKVMNGVIHPSDNNGESRVAGVLRFDRLN